MEDNKPLTEEQARQVDFLPVDSDAIFQLTDDSKLFRCNIVSVHLLRYKAKYDLDIWLDDKFESHTRIYNVESQFVLPYNS